MRKQVWARVLLTRVIEQRKKLTVSAAVICCAISALTGTVLLNSPAAYAKTVDVGSLSAADKAGVLELYEVIGGSGISSYADLKTALGGAAKDAASLGDTQVTLGGLNWDLVYVSGNSSEDVTATLWLSGSSDTCTYAHNWRANNTNYKYPSDMYGTSFVRSCLTGSAYAADANVTELTAGSASAQWLAFISEYGDYLGSPSQMSWQASETRGLPNEATVKVTMPSARDYQDRAEYFSWITDKLWLPSLTETQSGGIWGLTDGQRANGAGKDSLLRSGDISRANYTYSINADGSGYQWYNTDTALAVRPAIHLNLRAVSQILDEEVTIPEVTPEAQGLSGLNDGLIFNGGLQTAVRYNAEKVSFSGARFNGADAGENVKAEGGKVSVTHAGKYTVDFRLTDEEAAWPDGSTGIKTVEFEVRRRELEVITSSETEWDYDGEAKGITAELKEVPEGVGATLTISYRGASGSWSEAQPVNAGRYTVKVSLAQEHADYTVSKELEIEIKALALSISWSTSGYRHTETDGLHIIYDGEEHALEGELIGVLEADGDGVSVEYGYANKANAQLTDKETGLVPKSAGEYTVFAELKGDGRGNYYLEDDSGETVEYVRQSYKITRREVRIDWSKNPETGTYVWVYSGYESRTTLSCTAEKSEQSLSGDTGVITGESLKLTVSYADVTDGTAGAYDTAIRVNAGTYRARATQEDKNYKLINPEQDFEITRRKVEVSWSGPGSYGKDGDIFKYRYDSAKHVPYAEATVESGVNGVQGGADLTDSLEVKGAESEVTQLSASKDKGYYEAEAVIKAEEELYNRNFELIGSTKKYRIDKGEITGVTWYAPVDSGRQELTEYESYSWGRITGAGPGYTAEATAKITDGNGNETEVKFALTVTYPGANYSANEKWPVNDKGGYVVNGALTGNSISGSEYSGRFEFVGGSTSTEWKFYITPKAGEQEEITVSWVIFIDAKNYYTLEELSGIADGVTPAGGGRVTAADGKYTFAYTGKAQSPVAIYEYAQADSEGNTYEVLPQSSNGKKTNAGQWTAYVTPHGRYAYKSGTDECNYEITPLEIKLDWGVVEWQYNGTERKPSPVLNAEYTASQPDWYKTLISGMQVSGGELFEIPASGATDAGEYESECLLGGNFTYAEDTGKTTIKITPFRVVSSAITWDFEDGKNDTSGSDPDAWYWDYDGNIHAPVPSLEVSLDGEMTIKLQLKTIGETSAVGEHYVYAWLDGSVAENKNYILIESTANPVQTRAKRKFTIRRLEITAIYWLGDEAEDGFELDGKYYVLSLNGAVTLTHVFDGKNWSPEAYVLTGETYTKLNVTGIGRNAGKYAVRVADDYGFGGISLECAYEITPYVLEVTWKGSEYVYTGKEQKPEVEFTEQIPGEALTYEVSGGINAGLYTAELKITNPNYTYTGSGSYKFEITKKQITVAWTWTEDGVTETDGVFGRAYNGASPDMSVTADYENTEFTFGYTGRSAVVGSHKAYAKITSVTVDGASDDINNYEITSESVSFAYKITVYEVKVTWTGNADGKFEWVYDGNPHAPTASYTLWDGEHTATVTGARVSAGGYVASITMPESLSGNCVFDAGEQDFEITKAQVTVVWTFDEAEYDEETGEWTLTYDGNPHAPKAYVKDTNEELKVTGAVADAGKRHMASASLKDAANYEFATDKDSAAYFTIKVRKVFIKWIDESPEDYSWPYDGKEHAPKAVLANDDETEFLIDGKPVEAIISGKATHAGEYTATAEIVSSNYAFAETATLTHTFCILKVELDKFWWTDGDNLKDGVYEYVYNGQSQHPLAKTQNFTEFSYTFTNLEDNGEVLGITDSGYYKVKVSIVNNGDYSLPAGKDTVYVRISKKTVKVNWQTEALVYNGENQKPEAYYEDVNKVKYKLNVNVTGDCSAADTEYSAEAGFIGTVTNYELDTKSTKTTYKIAKRSIRIDWGEHDFDFDNEGHFVSSKVHIGDALGKDILQLGLEYAILDKDGVELKGVTEVIRAGKYKMVMRLTGPETVISNYELKDKDGDAEQAFEIHKIKLVITADDAEVDYGKAAPDFTATYGETITIDGKEVLASTLIGCTEESAGLIINGKRPWIDTDYVKGCVPTDDGYRIYIDVAMLGKLLPDYEIEARDGTLTVNAAPNSIIWYGDRLAGDPNFIYDGTEQKPAAYIYKHADKLEVVYVDENGEELENFHAITAGKYYVKAILPEGMTSETQFIEYEIFKREVVVNIHSFVTTYGDRELGSEDDILTEDEIKTLWSFEEGKLPVPGEDLEIYFTWDVKDKIINGYLQAGTYYVEGHYNNDPNYKVIFEGAHEEEAAPDMSHLGLYIVNKADITDNSKQGTEWFYEESVIEKYEKYFIRIEDKVKDEETGEESYRYVKYAGDQSAEVKFSYSRPYLAGTEEVPAPDENEEYPNTDQNHTGISDKGVWAINYRIEIANHNTYYGRWTVLIKYADEYVIIIFLKPYEIEYGDEVPENLTEILVDGGYVEISGAITDKEAFKKTAEAYVPLGYDKYVTSLTKAGKYNPCFRLNTDSTELSVIYRRTNRDEDSNLGMYVIKPRQLTVLWGATEYTYDGSKHIPVPVIGHWIGNGSFALDNITNGKTYSVNDAGMTVNVTVYTEGNFVSSGGHRVIISVDDPNYTILTSDAVQTISIKGAFPWWLVYTVGALALASLITFIIMAVIMHNRKRIISAGVSDEDGFYDPISVEEDESGLSDPCYASDYNDGFDYNKMWKDYLD